LKTNHLATLGLTFFSLSADQLDCEPSKINHITLLNRNNILGYRFSTFRVHIHVDISWKKFFEDQERVLRLPNLQLGSTPAEKIFYES
jgi:hypothetical protein